MFTLNLVLFIIIPVLVIFIGINREPLWEFSVIGAATFMFACFIFLFFSVYSDRKMFEEYQEIRLKRDFRGVTLEDEKQWGANFEKWNESVRVEKALRRYLPLFKSEKIDKIHEIK